ncbi:MAG: pilus assembly protein [Rhodobacteraceae bacterium]|nr:pilus assembly protein [Paracoccaceae bacterium]
MDRFIKPAFKAFRRDTDGSVSIETAFYLPFLMLVFASIYTYFDAFQQESANLKAAYTISDLVSRETNAINNDYIDSMHALTELLVRSDSSVSLRISVIRWDQDDDRYYVDWSVNRGTHFFSWTDATISQVEDDLPAMPDQERVILVETQNDVNAAFKIGLPDMNIYNFVFTRPRFAPQIVFEGSLSAGGTHEDGTEDTS